MSLVEQREREWRLLDGLCLTERDYPAMLRMGPHTHGVWRFCFALHGAYTDSWRHSYRTRTPRDLSVHPADEVHTSAFHVPTSCFHIAFTGPWQERLLGEFGIVEEPHELLGGRVPFLAEQLHREFRRREACSTLILEGLACELIGWAGRTAREERHGATWVFRARDLIADRITESLSLDEVAKAVDIHPVHLAKAFRRAFGCTIGDYVRRLRVEMACTEIDRGVPLVEVALRTGFADQSHLTRVFKRATGLTPRQFRYRS
jgi:AraC family transcriptional regulator